MATSGIITPGSLNLAVNPLLHKPGDMVRALNITNDQFGAKKKRPGYVTYLGTPDTAQVATLFNWRNNTGTQFWNYRASGSVLYYSTQGTGAWTTCGNGTITNGTFVTNAVLENTLLVSQDAGTTRHTTNGTSFTDTSAAPVAISLAEYQNRIWAGGTASSLFYSNVGTPTDWTNDSTSISIPGPGRLLSVFKAADRLVTTKNSGVMHRYNGYSLYDLASRYGPTSQQSIADVEGFRFYLNRLGVFVFAEEKPQLISNAVEKQIYNDLGSAIAGTVFDNAPGVIHNYQYLLGVGTVTDDLTNETIADCVLVYDYQANEWMNWQFAVRPYSWLSFQDNTSVSQLVFGDNSGQCYRLAGTATNDNGSTIPVFMEGVLHANTLLDKEWKWFRASFNPGCEAHIQVAIANTFTRGKKKWVDLGDALDGVVEYRFPQGANRGKFLFWKVYESSRNARFHFYGLEFDAKIIKR